MKLAGQPLKPWDVLLLCLPVAILARLLHWSPTAQFVLSALGVIPLAGWMGVATEELAHWVGPRLGGLLNATLGNAAELIITIFAIRAGLLELVKASITGSILGNLLLILGLSLLLGGMKHGTQTFAPRQARLNSTMVVLALCGLALPTMFIHAVPQGPEHWARSEALSIGTAILLMLIYALHVVYGMITPAESTAGAAAKPEREHTPVWSATTAGIALVLATAGIAWLSEILVHAVEDTVEALGWSEFFIGIIIVPLVGNVAEHLVAVQTALKNKMELSLAISLGSSLQIALFVAPLLVFVSLLMGNPMQLEFNQLEIGALMAASIVAAFIALDGESNWLEGAMLLVLYVIIGIAFFFV